jgi:hypothetical protein
VRTDLAFDVLDLLGTHLLYSAEGKPPTTASGRGLAPWLMEHASGNDGAGFYAYLLEPKVHFRRDSSTSSLLACKACRNREISIFYAKARKFEYKTMVGAYPKAVI